MSSLTTRQRNTIINLAIGLLALMFIGLAVMIYFDWQRSTPPNYTSVVSANDAVVATQLQDHLSTATYAELKDSITNRLSEDISHTSIRPGSFTESGGDISFIADISGTLAVYHFSIDTNEERVTITCPDRKYLRDQAWSCGIDPTGDDHDH